MLSEKRNFKTMTKFLEVTNIIDYSNRFTVTRSLYFAQKDAKELI
jgi:hypothetical protein